MLARLDALASIAGHFDLEPSECRDEVTDSQACHDNRRAKRVSAFWTALAVVETHQRNSFQIGGSLRFVE